MNVLENILKEIDKKADYYESDEQGREHVRMVDMIEVEEIIRSHMDDVSDENDIDSSKSVLLMLNEDGVAEVYDEKFDITIHCESKEEQEKVEELLKNVKTWIPVTDHLPKEKGWYQCSCCDPEIWSDGLVRDLFFHPETKEFVDNIRYFCNGLKDIEKYYWTKYVVAWQPLPEQYKGE